MVLTDLENETPQRPYAMVGLDDEPSGEGLLDSREMVVPATVYAYPAPSATRAEAARGAETIADTLWRLLAFGQDNDGPGAKDLLPLYAYDGRGAVNQLTIANATAGTFVIGHSGHTTGPLPRRCQPRTMRQALEALVSIGAGNVRVSAPRITGPWTVTFTGTLHGQDVPPLTIDGDDLTGPSPAAGAELLVAGSMDPWRAPSDFARVDRLSAGQVGDLSDPRQRTVRARMRLTWTRGPHVPSPEMLLQRVTARPA